MRKILAVMALLLASTAIADERILSFHSDIVVFTDGMIEVTETIKVRAEGKQIRRGIYRDFPVDYEDRLGNDYSVRMEPLAVLRNGSPEAFHTVRNRNDVRTYFGSRDRMLTTGEHTYTFRYRVSRMLGFFEEHDEIYWNVTGNRWAFPIDKASATVTMNFDAPRDKVIVDGYTGRMGSKAQEYAVHMDEAGSVLFTANKPLPAAHGLTVSVGWPKGLVVEPSTLQKIKWLLWDNRNLMFAVIGLFLVLTYYIPVWRKHGKDPEEGVIVTRYEPPKTFSPASLRYIRQMYYDDKVMTAAIVNLAVKGYLTIKKKGKTHSLHKKGSDPFHEGMAPGEAELYAALFAEGDSVTLKQMNHELLGKARNAHNVSLKADYNKNYFRVNGLLNIPAVIIGLIAMVLSLSSGSGPTFLSIATIILTTLTTVFFAIIMRRPTLRGRKLLDEMLGFKDYLEIAEGEDLNLRNPPEKTPELFESFLPYALALDVDQQWSEQFADVLAAIRSPSGDSYSPSWYNGSWSSSNLSRATTGLSSGLNSAVSSSVTAPGSSSGGGGGGSSGGGGGGGGGGGW